MGKEVCNCYPKSEIVIKIDLFRYHWNVNEETGLTYSSKSISYKNYNSIVFSPGCHQMQRGVALELIL